MASPTQFAFRTLKGIGIVNGVPVYEDLPGFARPEGSFRCCEYSPDGRYFAWASAENVTVVDASMGHVVSSIAAENVYELGFSPLGTFVITWQRPSKDENGDATKNLIVWRVARENSEPQDEDQGQMVARFVQKSQTGWNLQYTQDEKYCARMVSNEIQFYESSNMSAVWNKLHVDGVQSFCLSPGASNVAVFVPERKGQPAAVKIYVVPDFAASVSQKSFFKAEKVSLKWNDQGTSLIVLAQTEVDKSGKSYYGETTLYLLSATGGFDSRIDLDKEGPIYDVTWSPSSKEFGVVYGSMPAKATIFNSKAVATHSFALAPRNMILFSPHARFVLVAGFGQLAGEVDVYDLEKNYQKICTIKAANTSVCSWSPDGQHLLMAIMSPRLRVDNGVRIWHVSGSLMYNYDMQELYHVRWRPQPISMYPLVDPLAAIPAPHASALAYLGTVKTPSKPTGAYRPPGARGTSTPLAFMREDQGGAAFVSNGSMSLGGAGASFGKHRRVIPGAEVAEEAAPGASAADADENLSKAALKNKKKREAKKEKAKDSGPVNGPRRGVDNVSELPPSVGHGAGDRRSPERREHRRNNRSRTNSELRPRSQNRSRNPSQRRDSHAPRGSIGGRANGSAMAKPSTIISPQPLVASPTNTGVAPPQNGNAAAAAPPSPGSSSPAATTQDKKVRALTKKLRAIDDLKMRAAAGEKLEGTQLKKMETEESVRKELDGLGWSDG